MQTPEYRKAVRNYLRQMRGLYQAFVGAVSVFIPLLEGFLGNSLTAAPNWLKSPFFAPLCIVVVMHLFLIVVLLKIDTPAPVLYEELDRHREHIWQSEGYAEALQLQSDMHFAALTATAFTFGALEAIRSNAQVTAAQVMDKIMEPWRIRRSEIFGYRSDALWNFVLYWKSTGRADADEMKVVWRACDDRIVKANRTWTKGDGHIGRCWNNGTMQISPAKFHDTVLCKIQNPRPEDKKYYASVLTVPVIMDGNIMGVFVVTSSLDEQFTEDEHGQSAQILAKLIAAGLGLCRDGNPFALKPARNKNVNQQQ